MQVQVRARNLEVTAALRAHAERRLGRLEGLLPEEARLELELLVEPNPSIAEGHVAEATAWTAGPVLRARAGLERHLRVDRPGRRPARAPGAQVPRAPPARATAPRVDATRGRSRCPASCPRPSPGEEDEALIVKVKRFALKPMLPEEAVLQLELVDHAFFVFEHAETGEVNVVYRRRDGRFGLIEPARY